MSASAEHDLVRIANLVDRHIPASSPGYASKPAFLMGPGRRRKNVRSAIRVVLVVAVVLTLTQVYLGMMKQSPVQLLWLIGVLLLMGPLSVGLARDHPRIMHAIMIIIEQTPWVVLVLLTAAALASGLLVLLSDRPGDRFFELTFLTAVLLLTRTVLAQPSAGSLRARRLRRSIVAYASFLLWVSGGLCVVYVLVVLLPPVAAPTSGADPVQKLYTAVGFLLVVAGYAAAVRSRQRRHRAAIADLVDTVLVRTAYPGELDLHDLSLDARKLDRCLSSGSDTPAVLRSPFESLGIRATVQVLLEHAFGCQVLDPGEEARVAEAEVTTWTRTQARHSLTQYLTDLRADVTRTGEPFA